MSIEERTKDSLGFERNVTAASGAVFLVGLGEELWKKFLPKYLESLGASVAAVGLFGTAEDFFDAIYQYPGGWLADHWGRRRAFLIFLAAAIAGYFIYLSSPSWPYLFLGLAFVMAWHDSIDAKAHSHGDFAAGWRFDDRSARPAKRDSSRTRHYTRTGGVCGVATFLAPATDFGRRHREDNWGVELVSPHAETAPGFRHRDSNV